jgi:hypothetical protein
VGVAGLDAVRVPDPHPIAVAAAPPRFHDASCCCGSDGRSAGGAKVLSSVEGAHSGNRSGRSGPEAVSQCSLGWCDPRRRSWCHHCHFREASQARLGRGGRNCIDLLARMGGAAGHGSTGGVGRVRLRGYRARRAYRRQQRKHHRYELPGWPRTAAGKRGRAAGGNENWHGCNRDAEQGDRGAVRVDGGASAAGDDSKTPVDNLRGSTHPSVLRILYRGRCYHAARCASRTHGQQDGAPLRRACWFSHGEEPVRGRGSVLSALV